MANAPKSGRWPNRRRTPLRWICSSSQAMKIIGIVVLTKINTAIALIWRVNRQAPVHHSRFVTSSTLHVALEYAKRPFVDEDDQQTDTQSAQLKFPDEAGRRLTTTRLLRKRLLSCDHFQAPLDECHR